MTESDLWNVKKIKVFFTNYIGI